MILSLAFYLGAIWIFTGWWANDGLWLALSLFMIMRAVTLTFYYPRIEASLSTASSAGAKAKA